MNRQPAFLLLLAAAGATALPQATSAQGSTAQSHIAANVPAKAVFGQILQRDLTDYFRSSSSPSATSVDWTLLREQPTLIGINYPKFYAWVRVMDGTTVIDQGGVRMAAVDGKRFEVRNFVSAAQVNANPSVVLDVFPAPLIQGVIDRATAAK